MNVDVPFYAKVLYDVGEDGDFVRLIKGEVVEVLEVRRKRGKRPANLYGIEFNGQILPFHESNFEVLDQFQVRMLNNPVFGRF